MLFSHIAEEKNPMDMADRMQSDGPGHCTVKGQIYAINEAWNPTVSTYGVVKCVTCVCVVSEKNGRKLVR